MTPQELGIALRTHFAAQKQAYPKQSNLAEAWNQRHSRGEGTVGTVESRLSELFNGKEDGIKFFFADRERAKELLQLLRVGSERAAELCAAADRILTGKIEPRLHVDMRSLDDSGLLLACTWVERDLLTKPALVPARLWVTEAQARKIPRVFDEYREQRCLDWATHGVVGPDGVLLGPTPLLGKGHQAPWPFAKWAQFAVVGATVALDPPGALELLASDGTLAHGTASGTPLAELGVAGDLDAAQTWLDDQGPLWRGNVLTLLSNPPGHVDLDDEGRQGLGELLGLVALASTAEVVEHEVNGVLTAIGAAEVPTWTKAELDTYLARARLRPCEPVAVRVGDTVHAVNWPGAAEVPSTERLSVHEFAVPVPAITALQERLSALAPSDLRDSGDLDEILAELAETGHDPLALRHAAMALHLAGQLRTSPDGMCPEDVEPAERPEADRALALGVLAAPFEPVQLLVIAPDREEVASAEPLGNLVLPLPGGCLVDRSQPTLLVGNMVATFESRSYYASYQDPAWREFAKGDLDPARWCDRFEGWCSQYRDYVPVPAGRCFTVHANWPQVDAFARLLQAALQRAITSGGWLDVAHRRYLVPFGNGVCAEVSVVQGARERSTPRMCLSGQANPYMSGQVIPAWQALPLFTGAATCGPQVAERVEFAAGTVRLDVRFHADPFQLAPQGPWPVAVAAAVAAVQAAEQAQHYDDDDD